jgi:hypothetical protein
MSARPSCRCFRLATTRRFELAVGRTRKIVLLGWIILIAFAASPARSTELKPQTVAAFDEYVRRTENRMSDDLRENHFLAVDSLPDVMRQQAYASLWLGQVYIQPLHTLKDGKPLRVPFGLIHHWVGVAFIPQATIPQVADVLQDYEHQQGIYKPDVRKSKLLERNESEVRVFMQLYSKTVISVFVNANFDTFYTPLSGTRSESRSYSTRLAEVRDAGKPTEREFAVGNDHGYLWRIYSYWRVEEKDGGVYIQVESLGLSRPVPALFGWFVRPYLRSIPVGYLTRLLNNTRKAVTYLASYKGAEDHASEPVLRSDLRTADRQIPSGN